MPSKRNYCFTCWKPPVDFSIDQTCMKYMIYGVEICPDTGRLHYQGYVEFNEKVGLGFVKTFFLDPQMHIEPRFGSQQQAIEYCQKDGEFYEFGEPGYSGRRTDLENMISECKTLDEVKQNYPSTYCAYRNGLKDIYHDKVWKSMPTQRNIRVFAYIGVTGSGKTYRAMTENPDHYRLLNWGQKDLWFDGYTDQKCLIIDEFYGWIKYNYLLNLLDVYKMQLPIKGGFAVAAWEKVIITSNKTVTEWYPNVNDLSALHRRIHETINFDVAFSNDPVLCDDFVFNDVPHDFHVDTSVLFSSMGDSNNNNVN